MYFLAFRIEPSCSLSFGLSGFIKLFALGKPHPAGSDFVCDYRSKLLPKPTSQKALFRVHAVQAHRKRIIHLRHLLYTHRFPFYQQGIALLAHLFLQFLRNRCVVFCRKLPRKFNITPCSIWVHLEFLLRELEKPPYPFQCEVLHPIRFLPPARSIAFRHTLNKAK